MKFAETDYMDKMIEGTSFCNDLYLEDLLLRYGVSKVCCDEFMEGLTEEQKTDWNLIENYIHLVSRNN